MTSSVQKTFHENHKYIRGIDGLRALAVLAVLLFHLASTFLPGGFSGVDVFFVISGYVISASLARDSNSNLFHFITSFYARRIIRIFPALIVCLVAASIVTTLFVPASWLSSTSSRTGLFAFFGLSNFALVWFNDGYFAPRVEFNSFTHTWSLGVEEQFYAVFPLIMFVWLKYKEKKNIWGSLVNWLLAILLMISFLYSCYETSASPDKAFYLLPSRFWELACGALLFKLHSRQKLIPTAAIKQRFCLVAGVILVGLGFILSDKRSFPFPWAILSVGGRSGVRGVGYNFVISKSYGRCEIYIDRGEFEENKFVFDALIQQRESIEKTFGTKLTWERLDEKRASRIKHELEGVNVFEKEDWPKMIEFMKDGMLRLEKTFKEPLHKINVELKKKFKVHPEGVS